MKKKVLVFMSLLLTLTVLVGCSSLGGGISDEEKYTALSTLMSDPNPASDSDFQKLSGTFTFSAFTLTDKQAWDIEGKEMQYVPAMIARNSDDVLLINVDNLSDYDFPEGSFVSVTGKINGSIYWTEEGEQVSVLDITASKVVALPDQAKAPAESATFEVKTAHTSANYTFESAVATTSMGSNAVYVYYDFENTSDKDQQPFKNNLFVYQGDVELKKTILGGDGETNPEALEVGHNNQTFVGKTNKYVETYVPSSSDEAMNDTDPIEITQYDDDFNQVQVWYIELQ